MGTPGSFKVKIRWPKPLESSNNEPTQSQGSRGGNKKRKAQRDSPTGQNPTPSVPAKKAKKGVAPGGCKTKKAAPGVESVVELRGRRKGAVEGGSEAGHGEPELGGGGVEGREEGKKLGVNGGERGEGKRSGGAGTETGGRLGRGVSRVRSGNAGSGAKSQGGVGRSGELRREGSVQKAGGKNNSNNGGGEEGRGGCEKGQEVPRKEDLERVVDHVQKQDKNEIFKEPVTEDVAPNYFTVISKPMDFTTVRGKLAAGEYVKWDALEKDMMTMFQNAMTYNSPNTTFHKQAKTLMQVAKKLITLGKQGVTNFRGKTAGVVRAHNAQVAADDRAEKNAQKAAIRAQRMQMRNDKLIQKAAARGIRIPFGASAGASLSDGTDGKPYLGPNLRENDGRRPLPLEENVRWTYRPLLPPHFPLRQWGGLAAGANAEGIPFAASKMVVSNLAAGPVPADALAQSMLRFAKRIDGKARDYILMCAAERLP